MQNTQRHSTLRVERFKTGSGGLCRSLWFRLFSCLGFTVQVPFLAEALSDVGAILMVTP